VIDVDALPSIELKHSKVILKLRAGSKDEKKHVMLDAWYRAQIRAALPKLIAKWEPLMGVSAKRVFVQRVKTKWGSCNPQAKNPTQCLEYIVVHEMAHLIEPTYNARFVASKERFPPNWVHLRGELNRLPVRHENWKN
jgi:predicted metal-dependent hydrolase